MSPPLRASLADPTALHAGLRVATPDWRTDDGALARLWFGGAAGGTSGACVGDLLTHDVAEIDAILSEMMDEVLHDPALRRLEGSWRGLAWLAGQIPMQDPPQDPVRLRVLDMAWDEIAADFSARSDPRTTELFTRIYTQAFNSPGGEPFTLLVIDHELRLHPNQPGCATDIDTLERLGDVARQAWSPVVIGLSPGALGSDADEREGFAAYARSVEPADALLHDPPPGWAGLRDRPEARYIAVTLPRVLARAPWPPDPSLAAGFCYTEYAPSVASRVWMLAAYPLAAVVARAILNYGWPADILGARQDTAAGGVVIGLPQEPFLLGPEYAIDRPSLDLSLLESQELRIDARSERGLVAAGMTPLSPRAFDEEPVFSTVRSAARATADATAAMPGQPRPGFPWHFSALLCAAAIAHELKRRGRDMIGRVRTAEAIRAELRDWLSRKVAKDVSISLRMERPLLSADVTVAELPDNPGAFKCVLNVIPFQHPNAVAASFAFETELSK